jgi:hypothetical protein
MSTKPFTVAVVLALFLCGCGGPSNSDVRAEFLREHPDYTVLSVGVGEGDGSAAYFHIRYKRADESSEHEDVWQYLDGGDGPWTVNHKETIR